MDDQILQPQGLEGEVPSKIVINGQEYDSSDAQELIGLGQKTREYEQKWNTSLDRVWPEYGRLSQEYKTTQSELEKARTQLSQFEQKKDAGTETESDVMKAREAARKLGIIMKDDLDQSGYLRKDQLDSYLEEREMQRKAVEQVLQNAENLEKEIDGTDGRPKFNKKVVLSYANTYGFNDLKAAYEDMHADSINAWKEAQISAQKKPGLKTLSSTPGNKEPKSSPVTDDNVNDRLREALWGSN